MQTASADERWSSFMNSLIFMKFYGLSQLVYGLPQFQRMQTASANERWSIRELGIFAALLIGGENLAGELDSFTSCFHMLWVSPFSFNFLELARKGDFRYTLAGFSQIRRFLTFHWS